MVALRKCPTCGQDYKLQKYDVKGHIKYIYVPDCSCVEHEFDEIKSRLKNNLKSSSVDVVLPVGELPPLYEKYSFDNLENQDVVAACREFTQNFKKGRVGGFSFIGQTGTGKSVLLACVCKELARLGFSFLFMRTSELVDMFVQSIDFSARYKTSAMFEALREVDFLVLDDFGRGCLTNFRKEFLFRITDELVAYEKCLSITADPMVVSEMKSKPVFNPLFDRLAFLCPYRYTFKGMSFWRDVDRELLSRKIK